jgi:hypothetical protein
MFFVVGFRTLCIFNVKIHIKMRQDVVTLTINMVQT